MRMKMKKKRFVRLRDELTVKIDRYTIPQFYGTKFVCLEQFFSGLQKYSKP